jgi:DNA replication licensing factor MCM5
VLRVAASGRGELEVQAMRKFVQYAKAKCSPRLGDEAGQVLASSYVKIRDQVRRSAIDSAGGSEAADGAPAAIPITVRQLEALVRLSESLAKMRLDPEVRAEDVTEALRLFQVSTMAANAADQVNEKALSSTGGGSSSSSGHQHHREEMDRTEAFLRSRLQLGSLVNKLKIIEEAAGQGYNAVLVARALAIMASRGEVLERNQGRLLKRLK